MYQEVLTYLLILIQLNMLKLQLLEKRNSHLFYQFIWIMIVLVVGLSWN